MKIDSHMQILIGGKVYKTEGITRIEINGTDFEMDYEWGRYTLKCNVKDVRLFTDKPSMCDILLQDETRNMSHEFIYPSQDMRKAIKEAIEQMGKEPEPKTAAEMLRRDEYIIRRFMPCFKDENMAPTVSEEIVRKAVKEALEEMTVSMKNAGEQIKNGLESMRKATELIKVDISIDGEKFSNLIKDYGKPIARSGG